MTQPKGHVGKVFFSILGCFYVRFYCMLLACSLVKCRLLNVWQHLEIKMLLALGCCSMSEGYAHLSELCHPVLELEGLWKPRTCDCVYIMKF